MATKTTAGKSTKSTTTKTASAKTNTAKASSRKTVKKEQAVYIQYWGKEVKAEDVIARIKTIWTKEMGHKASELVDLKVYIKPEDNMAHYVINGDVMGSIVL